MATPGPGALSRLCLVAFGGLCLLLGLAETDRVTTAPGVVRPAGEALPVQAARDGRMAHWRLAADARVEEGQLLGVLDAGEERARRAAVQVAGERVEDDIARLEALLGAFAEAACEPASAECTDTAGRPQDAHHLREYALEVAERRTAALHSRTLAAERHTLAERLRAVGLQQRWQRPECAAHRLLARDGRVAEVQWWAVERRCAELDGMERSLAGDAAAAGARLAEHEEAERRRRAAVRRAWGESLGAALRERDALAAELALLDERLALTQVTAPATGLLDCTRPGFAGVWVRAGERLCSVLPAGVPSEVHAALPEQAREGVHEGQAVSLRVLALPWMQHGLLTGHVASISADTRSSDEPGGPPVYQVSIRIDPQAPLTAALTPGMRVEADLHRGREPLWRWLLSPLADLHLRAAREP